MTRRERCETSARRAGRLIGGLLACTALSFSCASGETRGSLPAGGPSASGNGSSGYSGASGSDALVGGADTTAGGSANGSTGALAGLHAGGASSGSGGTIADASAGTPSSGTAGAIDVGAGASGMGGADAGGVSGTVNVAGTAGAAVAGGAGHSGEAGASTGSAGSSPGDSEFELLYRDEFDTFDGTRWQLMTHSWNGNLAVFSEESVSVEDGTLVLRLLQAPIGTSDGSESKSFLGAEVRSTDALTYGRVRARAKLARGSAVVSALVTIYTPWPADNWNELDIECLGLEPANVQFNAMVYTGPPQTAPVTTSVTPTMHPQKVDLGFDPSQDFHVYTIEWTPSGARFLVDEIVRHTWSERIELMTLPQHVLMTIWASSSVEWAGAVTGATAGASAAYDWIELSRYRR